MAKLEVAFSPELFPVYRNDDSIVVVIDIFRATTAMCTAFENGVNSIIPVESIEEAKQYQSKGYLVGAERKGQVVEGFDIGNSPFHYMNDEVKGKDVVLTTTNGTRAISIAKDAHQIIIGAFTNISAVCDYLKEEGKDVLLLCAGWRGRYNLEDSLFAGQVVSKLSGAPFDELSDSAIAAKHLFDSSKNDFDSFLLASSHRRRLSNLNLDKDIEYCLKSDLSSIIPIMQDGMLKPVQRDVIVD